MHFRGRELKLTGSYTKIDVRTVLEQIVVFYASVACSDENAKFLSLQAYCMSYTTR